MCPKKVEFAEGHSEKIFSTERIPTLTATESQFYNAHKAKIKAVKQDYKLCESRQHFYYKMTEFLRHLQEMPYEVIVTRIKDFTAYAHAYLLGGFVTQFAVETINPDIESLKKFYQYQLMLSQARSIYLAIINRMQENIRKTNPNFNILSLLPNFDTRSTQINELSMAQLIALYNVMHQQATQKKGFFDSLRNKKELIDKKVFMQLADNECRKTEGKGLDRFYQIVKRNHLSYIQYFMTESSDLSWNLAVISAKGIATVLPNIIKQAVAGQQQLITSRKHTEHAYDVQLKTKVAALLNLKENEEYQRLKVKTNTLLSHMENFDDLEIDCENLEGQLIQLSRKINLIFIEVPDRITDRLRAQLRHLSTMADQLWDVSDSYNNGMSDFKKFYLQLLKQYWDITAQSWKLHYDAMMQISKTIDEYVVQLNGVRITLYNPDLEEQKDFLDKLCKSIKGQCNDFQRQLGENYHKCSKATQIPSFSEYMSDSHQGSLLWLETSIEQCKDLPKYRYAVAKFNLSFTLENIGSEIQSLKKAAEALELARQQRLAESNFSRSLSLAVPSPSPTSSPNQSLPPFSRSSSLTSPTNPFVSMSASAPVVDESWPPKTVRDLRKGREWTYIDPSLKRELEKELKTLGAEKEAEPYEVFFSDSGLKDDFRITTQIWNKLSLTWANFYINLCSVDPNNTGKKMNYYDLCNKELHDLSVIVDAYNQTVEATKKRVHSIGGLFSGNRSARIARIEDLYAAKGRALQGIRQNIIINNLRTQRFSPVIHDTQCCVFFCNTVLFPLSRADETTRKSTTAPASFKQFCDLIRQNKSSLQPNTYTKINEVIVIYERKYTSESRTSADSQADLTSLSYHM